MSDPLVHEFFLGFIKIHILHHACEEEVFGKEFAAELARHGYKVSYGTLYPTFHRMEALGLLVSRSEVVAGKTRKYYSATPKGREVLVQAKERLGELVAEVLKPQPDL